MKFHFEEMEEEMEFVFFFFLLSSQWDILTKKSVLCFFNICLLENLF